MLLSQPSVFHSLQLLKSSPQDCPLALFTLVVALRIQPTLDIVVLKSLISVEELVQCPCPQTSALTSKQVRQAAVPAPVAAPVPVPVAGVIGQPRIVPDGDILRQALGA